MGLIRDTKLDYDLISLIISRITNVKKNTYIRLIKTKGHFSYYCEDSKTIAIDLKQGNNLREIVKTILHEIRHLIQTKQFKITYTDYSTYKEYYNTPEEIDARNYEKLGSIVCKLYKQYKELDQKYDKLKLDKFNELV